MKPFIIATSGYLQDFAHLHYTELVAVFVYKFKDYSCSFVAKMRAAFFIMAFSSSRSLILSSNSFSRLRCSLGVTNSSSSAFNCCSSLYLVQLSIKYSCFLRISPTPIKGIYWSLHQNHYYLNLHTLYNTS